jgi:hypothetical protein
MKIADSLSLQLTDINPFNPISTINEQPENKHVPYGLQSNLAISGGEQIECELGPKADFGLVERRNQDWAKVPVPRLAYEKSFRPLAEMNTN